MNLVKIHSIFIIIVMLTFISCKDNENASVDDEYPIEVEAHIDSYYTSNNHASRGVKLTASSLQSFGVYSFYNGAARVRDATFTKSGTSWSANKAMTWAAGAMDFYTINRVSHNIYINFFFYS